jgi:hypothetical protein
LDFYFELGLGEAEKKEAELRIGSLVYQDLIQNLPIIYGK